MIGKVIGKQIRVLRERQGLNQTELARILQVVPSVVCDWERGVYSPRLGRLKSLAKALKVSVADLVAW